MKFVRCCRRPESALLGHRATVFRQNHHGSRLLSPSPLTNHRCTNYTNGLLFSDSPISMTRHFTNDQYFACLPLPTTNDERGESLDRWIRLIVWLRRARLRRAALRTLAQRQHSATAFPTPPLLQRQHHRATRTSCRLRQKRRGTEILCWQESGF